jgi:biopolymer transport protein ExbD
MFSRPKRRVPSLNTTATADISFMLLIFFLVTSSMDSDKGLPRQLPPPENEQVEQELKVKERNVLRIALNADDQLTCNEEPITAEALTKRVADFVANAADDPSLPEKSTRELNYFGRCQVSDRHVLLLQVDRQTSYDAYFQMQNAIARAYNQLRNDLALRQFHRPYAKCSPEQRNAIALVYPQRISEAINNE